MTGRPTVRMLCLCALVGLAAGCGPDQPEPPAASTSNNSTSAVAPLPGADHPDITLQELGQSGFVPMGFTDATTLWGILRGRLTSMELASGALESTRHTAWSVAVGPGVVGWRNELGIWAMRGEGGPRRLAPTELIPGYDGPPDVLWAPNGQHAILSWAAEWDFHHALLQPDGTRSALITQLTDYMLDRAVLWLDDHRVLFQVVATGPQGGEAEYRESGWRGDLAVLELGPVPAALGDSTEFRQVTHVPDGAFLQVAGLLSRRVLVMEREGDSFARHWLYDPDDWSRQPVALPPGRVWGVGNTIVSYEPIPGPGEPRFRARLFAVPDSGTTPRLLLDLGSAPAADPGPAISADGSLVALRVLTDGRPRPLLARLPH